MSLLIESIKAKLGLAADKLVVKFRNYNSIIVRQFASFALLSLVVPAMYSTAAVSEHKEVSEPQNTVTLKFDPASDEVIASTRTISEIVPGESSLQKLAREQAEKEKVEAEAKAVLEAIKKRNTVSREARVYADPSDFDQIYQAAGDRYGVSPILLKAVHTIETGRSGSTSRTSYAGAQGPMQFLPSTWRRHGVDGNGDGVADINNVNDAIFSAAAYLKACGYPDVKKALWGYNPSTSYYNKVMNVAHSFGF